MIHVSFDECRDGLDRPTRLGYLEENGASIRSEYDLALGAPGPSRPVYSISDNDVGTAIDGDFLERG